MKKQNTNVNNNTNDIKAAAMAAKNNQNNNQNQINGGKKIMKNTIKEAREALAAKKAAEAAAKTREERLAAIEPVDVVGTMAEVINGTAHAVRNEDGYSLGANGGKLYQYPIYTENGASTIAADSPEGLERLKKEILEEGRQGDGKFHRMVTIGGIPCDCCGATLEELEADIAAAEDYYQAHIKGSVTRDIDVAEQLVDAGYKAEDLEEVRGSDGLRYVICYDGNYIMTLGGETVADLEDLKSKLGREDVKTLLVERLEKYIEERIAEEGEYDDYYDEDEDYDEEDCDEDEEW